MQRVRASVCVCVRFPKFGVANKKSLQDRETDTTDRERERQTETNMRRTRKAKRWRE